MKLFHKLGFFITKLQIIKEYNFFDRIYKVKTKGRFYENRQTKFV